MNWAKRYMNYLLTWRQHRQVIKELNALTDAELKDIGINRGCINDLIWLNEDKDNCGK